MRRIITLSRRCISMSQQSLYQNKHIEYCRSLVKSRDYENYLACVLLPGLAQNVAFTVRAFNIEVAQIQESTTQAETAKIRIDFWRKHVANTFQGRPPNHPVAISLALCLEQQWLSEKWLQRIVDIREKYLNNVSFMTLDDAEDYGEYAVSSLYYLMLESMNESNNDTYYAASHLGIACSLITMIKSTRHYLQNGSVHLPLELCVKHNVSQEELLRNQKKDALAEIIFEVASQASLHVEAMKKLLGDTVISRDVKNVFLPHVTCTLFLEHVRKLDFDIYQQSLNNRKWSLPLLLYISSKKKKIS